MIFGSYSNGTITAWNITTRQVIHQFQDQKVENRKCVRNLFHAAGCLLVSCLQFVSINGIHHHKYMNYNTHITIRRMLSPEDMFIDNTLVIPYSRVLQFNLIPNYFVLLFKKFPLDGRLQLRSKVDFQVVREMDLEIELGQLYQSTIFSYTNGLLVTIDGGEVYIFWDPETLHKMFSFETEFDNESYAYLTTYNLIARSFLGSVKILNLPIILRNNGVDFVESICEVSIFSWEKESSDGLMYVYGDSIQFSRLVLMSYKW